MNVGDAESEARADRYAKCPLCGHAWKRHDPEDGECDAATMQGLGVCRCGRDIGFMAEENARLAREALAAGEQDGYDEQATRRVDAVVDRLQVERQGRVQALAVELWSEYDAGDALKADSRIAEFVNAEVDAAVEAVLKEVNDVR